MDRVVLNIIGCFLVWLPLPLCAQPTSEPPSVEIGLVLDGPWERNDEVVSLFQTEILELTQREFDITIRPPLIADWTLEGVQSAVENLIAEDSVDLIIPIGVIGSHYAAGRDTLPIPVIAPVIVDPDLQGLSQVDGGSGKTNLNYLAVPNTLSRDLRAFRRAFPFDNLVLLGNLALRSAIPDMLSRFQQSAAESGVTFQFQPVGDNAEAALNALPADADAVYLFPQIQLPSSQFDRLIAGLIERGLPSFSRMGEPEVERGILMGLNPDLFPRLSRRVALHTQRILLGDDPASLSTAFAPSERLVMNFATMVALSVSPPVSILLDARNVGPEPVNENRAVLTLSQAVQQGIVSNLDLMAEEYSVAAGAENLRLARANLLPDLSVSVTGSQIDEDRALASGGRNPQRLLSGDLQVQQIIYSEPVYANLAIQRHLQTQRELNQEALRLDIASEVSESYLNLLRATALEDIQTNNLDLTRTNLELARIRQSLGQANAGEILRWESQIAQNTQNLLNAYSNRRLAMFSLNQLLNQPLETEIDPVEITLSDPLIGLKDIFEQYGHTLLEFDALRDALVRIGLDINPDLKALDEVIAATERNLKSKSAAFWSPTVALQGDASRKLADGGASSDISSQPGAPDSFDWSVGINVSLPLFQGGARRAEERQVTEELNQLITQRELAAQRVEQNIRSTVMRAGIAFVNIEQAEAAAEAAQESLDLVKNAYSQGAATLVDLLEAQNTALTTNLATADATYDFLIQTMQVERALGQFDFFRTETERSAFRERIRTTIGE